MTYGIGLIVGFLISIIVIGGLVWLIYKNKVLSEGNMPKFDERQLVARGQCYRVAFFSLLIYMTMYALLISTSKELNQFLGAVGIIIGIFLSAALFAILCILKGAYEGLNEKRKNWKIMFLVIGVFNFVVAIFHFRESGMIEDGTLSTAWINFGCGTLMILLLVVQFIKERMDAREE